MTDMTTCAAWCPSSCSPIERGDLVELIQAHHGILHVTRHQGDSVLSVEISRVDNLTDLERGTTEIALVRPDLERWRITVEQARNLSDALDYAARQADQANDGRCADCSRPSPGEVLDAHDGRCLHCRTRPRLRLVGSDPSPVDTYQPPTDEAAASVIRGHVQAQFGDKATRVDVVHHDATPHDNATDLIRLRLDSGGYLTARGARKLADYLNAAADVLSDPT